MDTQSNKPVAVVTGVGPGLGASLARRFAQTYAVALLARKADYLKALAREIRQSGATVLDFSCDVSDRAQLAEAFRAIRTGLGDPEVLLYNAGTATLGAITEVAPEKYEADWRINAYGAFVAAKEVAPGMIARGRGAMLFTGATAGVKAGPRSVSFGPAKFAMRGLAQSLARELSPRGIHVAHFVIDGGIRSDRRAPSADKPDALLDPDAIAQSYLHVLQQPRSAWTFELEVRPWVENF